MHVGSLKHPLKSSCYGYARSHQFRIVIEFKRLGVTEEASRMISSVAFPSERNDLRALRGAQNADKSQ
jgi:hypothetical protein